jgi:hypothetical protein
VFGIPDSQLSCPQLRIPDGEGLWSDYNGADADAMTLTIGGVAVPVANLAILIRTKNTLRPPDAADGQSTTFIKGSLQARSMNRGSRFPPHRAHARDTCRSSPP